MILNFQGLAMSRVRAISTTKQNLTLDGSEPGIFFNHAYVLVSPLVTEHCGFQQFVDAKAIF